jgi:hypothetical protein
MKTLPVVEHLDVIEHRRCRLLARDCLEIGGAGVEVVVSRLISDRR